MNVVWIVLGALVALVAGWIILVAVRGTSIPAPGPSRANPAGDREEAAARLRAIESADGPDVAEACRTRLLEPDGPAVATLVIWHGFTNCPAQFADAAELLRQAGLRVLLVRMPAHGLTNVLTRQLADVTSRQLTESSDAAIDCAAGYGDPVWTAGLSAGAVLAAWAAATRPEVSRTVLIAPFVAPKAFPMPAVRLLVRFRGILPRMYIWWDPRKKENLRESPYVYPGFPLPGMVGFLHLAQALYDRHVVAGGRLNRVVLVTNPGDFAIRRDVARSFTHRTFDAHADLVAEAEIDEALGWWHDFVDPHGPHHGSSDQVSALILSALGIADNPSAGGVFTSYPEPQPVVPDVDGR